MEIGRNEILIGVAVIALLLLIAVPFGISKSKKTRRAEVPLVVKAIHQAEVDYHAAFGSYEQCEAAPRAMHAVTKDPVPWASNRGYDKLSWKPDTAEVYGAYKVAVEGETFTVTGACDIDGDGERALFTASNDDTEAVMSTEANIY